MIFDGSYQIGGRFHLPKTLRNLQMNKLLAGAIAVFLTCLIGSYCQARPRHYGYDNGQVIAHPSGCPWSQFCGCGAAVKVYGHPVAELALAWNWARDFPRTSPHAGAAAVWSHHVAIIESYSGGDIALAYDANSGGHLTREHQISLAGATIVQPGGEVRASKGGTHYATNSHRHYRSTANNYASLGFAASGPGSNNFH